MAKIHFIAGQTRSGSELLCNILAQNPKFDATATSGIMDVIFGVRNNWDNLVEFKATPNDEAKKRVMKAMLHAYHNSDKKVVFDKCRGWAMYSEMAKELLDHDIKILVPVRDMRQVLSSWEKLYRKEAGTSQSHLEKLDYFKAQTVQGRCELLLRNDQPVGLAHNRIIDALQRGWGKNMFFVDYDDLTNNPEGTMKAIHTFLGEPYFEYDFNNVEQVTKADDAVYGFKDLHKIRKEVKPQPDDWKEVLGEWADDYRKLNFWKQDDSEQNAEIEALKAKVAELENRVKKEKPVIELEKDTSLAKEIEKKIVQTKTKEVKREE